ncbi:GTP cyclohydrolase II [Tahibacter amnicola]|uniref:GTP cyclohydrolase-2 n=1 Tax=Tahibacter amnicola TaxID=2976241 RepID=A0ABY6BKF1_9GAMM|nr:GTP cyclohydrolase II [Tahibacter amnicola]UXI70096.1 GTP cyclohydrolase II [Tahibacter amnicola]
MKIPTAACARLPVDVGAFQTTVFDAYDGKEHVALTMGELADGPPALVRIHSECFTGDVLGSHRCDCGEQLAESMRRIAREGRGAVLYLRQEGRGIGLAEKLRAYQLQDLGFDTVDANIELGHAADARDYGVAASILRDLGVHALQLMTNNPAKVAALTRLGIEVVARVPLVIPPRPENREYLNAKARRMGHLLDSPDVAETKAQIVVPAAKVPSDRSEPLFDLLSRVSARRDRPFVTLSYAQSLDGSSAALGNRPLAISGGASRCFTHRLRAAHDAILVGIGTILADDPRLTVREAHGVDPQPVIVDSRLRFPLDARLLTHPTRKVWIATTPLANPSRMRRLESLGAELLVVPVDTMERVDLSALLALLRARGVRNLMIEGGGRVLTQVVDQRLFDLLVLTVAPMMVGGTPAFAPHQSLRNREHTRIDRPNYLQVGDDLVIWGAPQVPGATGEGARDA